MQKVGFLLASLLAVPVCSISMPRAAKIASEAERIASIPMRLYKSDCWKKRPVSLLQKNASDLPGAGLGKIVPFQTVLKDGYFQAECVKDYMFNFGDKFGKNSAAYNQGQVSDVSIVRYSEVVPAEDKEAMSHAVCFAFCRTVPDMLFFGIANGRDCYCAPYYKAMAGDDSMCDQVCPGQPSTMCGGKSKSSMFSMHSCDSTARDLAESSGRMEEIASDMMALHKDVDGAATEMQAAGAALQASFGKAGDAAASDLMQSAKVFAGKLQHSAEAAKALDTDVAALKASADSMSGADFTSFAKAKEAETLNDKMDEVTTASTEKTQELEDLKAEALPADVANASQGYYPVMYFVNKTFDSVPSTCDGEVSAKPSVGSANTCASACDAQVGTCVGYSFFESADVAAGGLCFLFSKLKSVQYYTGCASAPTFLQMRASAGAAATKCMAKFQDFEGTTLKPDPSGKCKLCLREATEAKRCYK